MQILDLALEGDPIARRILDNVSECVATVCSYLSLILNCSLIVFGGELGMHPALLQAVSVRLEDHDFARPRLAITQLGAKVENRGALRVALQAADASLRPQWEAKRAIPDCARRYRTSPSNGWRPVWNSANATAAHRGLSQTGAASLLQLAFETHARSLRPKHFQECQYVPYDSCRRNPLRVHRAGAAAQPETHFRSSFH
jgi:predicted NBD/HSP70 family sugar kinase